MTEFHNTQMGKKFFNKDLPDLIIAINKLAAAFEKHNVLEHKKNINEKQKSDINLDINRSSK